MPGSAAPGEERRCGAARGAAADDGHVVGRVRHAAIKFSKLAPEANSGAATHNGRGPAIALLIGNGRGRAVDLGQVDGELSR